jgi:hypothetical protein
MPTITMNSITNRFVVTAAAVVVAAAAGVVLSN